MRLPRLHVHTGNLRYLSYRITVTNRSRLLCQQGSSAASSGANFHRYLASGLAAGGLLSLGPVGRCTFPLQGLMIDCFSLIMTDQAKFVQPRLSLLHLLQPEAGWRYYMVKVH